MTRIERQKPVTEYNERQKPTTTYNERIKPYKYIDKLQDDTNIVCNEDGVVIYIYASVGKPIVSTIWTTR